MRFEIIALIFASAVYHHFVSTSANSIKREDDIKTIFKKFYSKFDDLIESLDKLEANSSTGNDAIKQFVQQIQKFNDRFEEFENLTKIEKCEENNKNIEKCEADLLKFQKSLKSCEPNPCNGGSCEVLPDGSGYRCTRCPVYAEGKNCEKVKCDSSNKCFKRNDTLYVVFETNSKWEEADRMCASEGMTLAMPKDVASSKFIKEQLRPIYVLMVYQVVFWIGLKYNGTEKQWQWTDGSALGDYTGGWVPFKYWTNDHCGYFVLLSSSHFWSNGHCYLTDYISFYPLCEKRISAV